ncbi:unnamed protein product [Arabidopsis thaliana]|uniref:Endonuclease/exonuclease/phosphatase domain-containing protein n=1 Tax=Arabidopsis thaliana TaxID=3702 RepID=A0A5S9WJG5_ARATH|nr:unnamed protein product [Arabidopsis thaliana]
MAIFFWNVRGLNSRSRQRIVRSWIALNNLLVGYFLETHVAEDNASSVLAATLPGWRMDSYYCCSELGRIWIVWDLSVSVLVFSRTDQLMVCSIKIPDIAQSFAVTFVYGRNTEAERRSFWDDITRLSASSPLCNSPWLLVGDFNQIASVTEHYSLMPSNISLRGLEDLQACMRDSDLVDLPCRGVLYTWSNHQQDNPILRKLDRAIVNGCWLATFPTASAIFDPPSDSDHAACMKEIAVGSFMFSLGELLKEAKKACRDLNRRGFSNIQQRTKESLSSLEDIQAQLMSNPSDFLFRAEHVARKNWNFFAAALESFYKQKSRIKWLKEGDLELLTSYLEEADLIMSKHSTPRSSRSFKISRDHSTPRSSRRNHHFTSPLDHEVECPHLHHLTITRSNHSTPWSSVFTFIARPLLDFTTLP